MVPAVEVAARRTLELLLLRVTPVVIVEGFEEGAPVVLRGIVRRTEASDEDGEAQLALQRRLQVVEADKLTDARLALLRISFVRTI